MKLKTKNFSGKLELPYRIIWNQPKAEETEVIVWLSIINPFTKLPVHLDCVIGASETTYKENVKIALLKAEEKWGIELLKMDLTTI